MELPRFRHGVWIARRIPNGSGRLFVVGVLSTARGTNRKYIIAKALPEHDCPSCQCHQSYTPDYSALEEYNVVHLDGSYERIAM
jgi:hypothetical protein